jgi:hypothetical protein
MEPRKERSRLHTGTGMAMRSNCLRLSRQKRPTGSDDACLGAHSKLRQVALSLPTQLQLEQQGEIRALRGRLCWEGDLEAQRLDSAPASADPEQGERR